MCARGRKIEIRKDKKCSLKLPLMTMLPIGKGKRTITVKEKELQVVGPHSLRCNRNMIKLSLVSFARKVDM